MKKYFYSFSILLALLVLSCSPESAEKPKPPVIEDTGTFYISPAGDDENSGNTPEEAWRTIDKVNSVDFEPGNKILFEAGKEYIGTLELDRNDAKGEQEILLISSYGTGKAIIKAGDGFGINAYNTAGIYIENLIFAGSGKNTNTKSGISFYNDLDGNEKLINIKISNCEIYGFRDFGIAIGGNNENSGFSEVRIENNRVHDILDSGISSYGYFSPSKTGYAHSNITVKNCEVFDISGYDKPGHSGNGIVLSDVQNSVIENSTVYNCGSGNTNCGGPVGIWFWDSDKVIIQNNEVYNMSSGTGCDGGGFDLDGGVTNGIMQYNYSHDNDGAGFLVGQFTGARPMDNITVRYNISENDAATNGGSVYLFNGDEVESMDNIFVYNNTLYIGEQTGYSNSAAIKLLDWKKISGNINFFNNILYATNGVATIKIPPAYAGNFQGNLYYNTSDNLNIDFRGDSYRSLEEFRSTGNEVFNEEAVGYQGDPLLQSAGNGGTIGYTNDLNNLKAYKLEADSPAIDTGINLSREIGDSDFYGNDPLQNSAQDIGAHEY